MKIRKFEDIIAWQKARVLVIQLRASFKDNKDFSFKDQLFRASLSIMNNIAEGFDRGTDKELKHFLVIARGSTAEVRSMLVVALDFDYLPSDKQHDLIALTEEISRLLTGFIKKLNWELATDD